MDDNARMKVEQVIPTTSESIPALVSGSVPVDRRTAISIAVAAWREQLAARDQTNSTIRRKLTTLRSLFVSFRQA
jgi:hypothetical protein